MASMEEIMITFNSKENVSDTTKKIDGSVQSMVSNISAAMSKMNQGFMSLSTGMNSMLGGLTGGKTASDIIFGTASKAETNKVLLDMMTETEDAAKSLYDTVDKVTDSSLTSMQELIPAMNAFKAATGASDTELENVTDEMANFGAAVLAQTGSTELAQSAMMDLSKGIKGAFASLDQYGVSEDALKRTGLWSGKEDDVEGYMAAVEKVVGSTEKLMETNQGLDALIGKSFSRAGKKIGNEFLPIIKDIKRGFIDLDNELGGGLAATILIASESVDVLSQSLFTASTMINGVQDIAAEGFNNSLNIASNASDMAGLTGVAGAGDVAKGASKGENAVEAGTDVLFAADMLKDTKSKNKDYAKLKKELESSKKLQNEIGSSLDALSVFDSLPFNSGKASKPISKQLSDIGFFDDALFAGMKKFGAKGNKKAIQQYSDVLLENMTNPIQTIEDLVKSNDGARKEAGKLLEELSPANTMLDEDTLKLWEKSERTATEAIGNHLTGFKEKITGAFSSIKDFDFKGTITAPFSKIATSIKNFSFGET